MTVVGSGLSLALRHIRSSTLAADRYAPAVKHPGSSFIHVLLPKLERSQSLEQRLEAWMLDVCARRDSIRPAMQSA